MKARGEVHGLVSSPFIGLWLIYFGPFSGNPRHGPGWCPLSWTVLIKLAPNWFKNCGSGLILAQWGTIQELLLIHTSLWPRRTPIYFVFLQIHLFWVSMQHINSKISGVVATLPILKGKTNKQKKPNKTTMHSVATQVEEKLKPHTWWWSVTFFLSSPLDSPIINTFNILCLPTQGKEWHSFGLSFSWLLVVLGMGTRQVLGLTQVSFSKNCNHSYKPQSLKDSSFHCHQQTLCTDCGGQFSANPQLESKF